MTRSTALPQNIIPDIASVFFGKIDGDKICPSCTGIADKTKCDHNTVDQTAENTDQQRIIGNGLRRDQVRKNTGQDNDNAGTHSELDADKPEADKNRKGVQGDVDDSIRNLQAGELPENILKEQCQSVEAAGDKSSGIDKGVDVYRADDGGYNSAAVALHFNFRIHGF